MSDEWPEDQVTRPDFGGDATMMTRAARIDALDCGRSRVQRARIESRTNEWNEPVSYVHLEAVSWVRSGRPNQETRPELNFWVCLGLNPDPTWNLDWRKRLEPVGSGPGWVSGHRVMLHTPTPKALVLVSFEFWSKGHKEKNKAPYVKEFILFL